MADPADIQRLVGDIAREGTVVSVDHDAGTCRVQFTDDLVTGDIPWLCARAGATRTWSPPSLGEEVAVLSPEGDAVRGIVIGSLSSDDAPHPANDKSTLTEFGDGARIGYDPETHALTAILPAGAIARIDAPGGMVLKGPVEIDGPLTVRQTIDADGEITARGVKLSTHKHGLVKAGTDQSGPPS